MNKNNLHIILFISIMLIAPRTFAQFSVFRGCPVTIDFTQKLRTWDGFGFNYVETAQTTDYDKYPTDYGGFSIMKEQLPVKYISLNNEGEDWERWP